MIKFLDKYFFYIWMAGFLFFVAKFIQLYLAKRKKGSLFPDLENQKILYRENFASGRSLAEKNGWASNILKIIVTEDELWITSGFPFNIFLNQWDLEHRIQRDRIFSIIPKKSFLFRSYILKFTDSQGVPKTLELIPKKRNEFERALNISQRESKG